MAHRRALEAICEGLSCSAVPWAVTGSVALALQGVPVGCRDLDLVTSGAGARPIERLFARQVVEPVEFGSRDHIRGHFGRLRLREVDVEVLGDVQNLMPDGTWTVPPRLDVDVMWLQLGERQFPVLRLTCLRDAYSAMGRSEKVLLIASALSEKRCQATASWWRRAKTSARGLASDRLRTIRVSTKK
jgi:hypothetical protein